MSKTHVGDLINLLKNGQISKDELMTAMNQMEPLSCPKSLAPAPGSHDNFFADEEPPENEKFTLDHLPKKLRRITNLFNQCLENIRELEKDFEPILGELEYKEPCVNTMAKSNTTPLSAHDSNRQNRVSV